MLTQYRIRKLTVKVAAQKALVNQLKIAERGYGSSYYTDKLCNADCKYAELSAKLKLLEDRIAE